MTVVRIDAGRSGLRAVHAGDGAVSASDQSDRQLLIDVSTIARHDARTGIQRVVRAVATALLKHPAESLTVRLVAASRTEFYRELPSDWLERSGERKLDLSTLPPVKVRAGDIFFGLDFSINILTSHERKIAAWAAQGVSINIVVYDLLPLSDGRWFTFRMRRNFRRWLRFVERHADGVIAISQAVAQRFQKWQTRRRLGPSRSVPVSIARLGSDISASLPSRGMPADSSSILRWMGDTPTVLMVGTIEPRKGYAQALRAFQRLWGKSPSSPQLVIVGRGGWKTSRLQAKLRSVAEDQPKLVWLEGASDEFLEEIYQRAAGLLVASNGEGFGLPIVEALSMGVPVLARDIPVFRELDGSGVTFFEGEGETELAKAVEDWLAKSAQRAKPSRVTANWEDTVDDIASFLVGTRANGALLTGATSGVSEFPRAGRIAQ